MAWIDRDILISKAEHEAKAMSEPYKSTLASIVDWLSAKVEPIPDVAPVVKCKDCVNVRKSSNNTAQGYYCALIGCRCDGNFYCAMGERKEI